MVTQFPWPLNPECLAGKGTAEMGTEQGSTMITSA